MFKCELYETIIFNPATSRQRTFEQSLLKLFNLKKSSSFERVSYSTYYILYSLY